MKERLEKWLAKMGRLDFPVLSYTKERMQDEESLSNELVTDILENDVGLAINIIHRVNTHARSHLNHRLTTLEYAAVMLGKGNIREIALASKAVEEYPEKIAGYLLRAYGHALHTAMISREIAVMRNDLVPDELYLAGLLHSVGGLAMWLLAPNGMRTVRALLKQQHRSLDEMEYLVFGFSQGNLSYELAKMWNMPEAAKESMQAGAASLPRLRGVAMAEHLSYMATHTYRDDMLLETLEQIATFLGKSSEAVIDRLGAIHNSTLSIAEQYGALMNESVIDWDALTEKRGVKAHGSTEGSVAHELVQGEQNSEEPLEFSSVEEGVICLSPRFDMLNFLDRYIDADSNLTLDALLEETVHLLHDGVGLNRVMYAAVVTDHGCLKARYSSGADRDITFNLFSVNLSQDSIFRQLLLQQGSMWMTVAKWQRMPELIPKSLRSINGTKSFFAQTLMVRGRPHGIFYADRRIPQCRLEHHSFQHFQEMVGKCQLVVNQLIH